MPPHIHTLYLLPLDLDLEIYHWFSDIPMYNLSIGHFPNQDSTSHRADGKMAEGIFWYGQSIPDSIRDAVTTYWISKFGFS